MYMHLSQQILHLCESNSSEPILYSTCTCICLRTYILLIDTQELKTDMKGILSEEMKKSEAEQKNKSGRSLKLSKKEDRGASRDEAKTTFAESAQTSEYFYFVLRIMDIHPEFYFILNTTI